MIEVSALEKRFGATRAVDGLSFGVPAGTVTGFLGPNGAGKTTTLRALLGLIAPDAGAATIDGRPYRELAGPTRRVGAVLEASGFHPGRSGRNHLRAIAAAARLPRKRVEEVLATVGMAHWGDMRVGNYSLGMRQRLGLAGALLGDPDVLVLDEPANGLDPEGIHWLRTYLRERAEAGGTILVSSHVLSEVAQTVDEVVIVNRGRLVAHAPIAELTARASPGVRARSPQAEALAARLREAGLEVAAAGDGALLVTRGSPEQVGELAAGHGIVLHELVRESSNLEEVFLELTSDDTP